MSTLPAPIEVFYLYADADESLCTKLDKHLKTLQSEGLIKVNYKGQIPAGTDKKKTFDRYLSTAQIILLLISHEFIADHEGEIQRAMERHNAEEARVIPILLQPVDWQSALFKDLQVLPRSGRPVTKWSNRNQAFTDVANGIRDAVRDIQHLAGSSTLSTVFPHQNGKGEIPAKDIMHGNTYQNRQSVLCPNVDGHKAIDQYSSPTSSPVAVPATSLLVESKNFVATDLHQLMSLLQRYVKVLKILHMDYVKVLEILHMDKELTEIQLLIRLLSEQSFKILVIGEFNGGKSTVINALLGEKVLPIHPIQTTTIITRVKWSARKYAIVYEGSKEFEIPPEDLEDYVTAEKGQSNPYDRVELFWPLKFCENGVEIIDSPGLNVRNKEHSARTDSSLSATDAVIFVSDAQSAGSDSEMTTLKRLKDMGHTDILFICNKINLIEMDQRKKVKDDFVENFSAHIRNGAKSYVFLNAKGALDGRINRNESAVHESGIYRFEELLNSFLVNKRETIKLLHPAMKAQSSIQHIRASFVDCESSLKTEYHKFQDIIARVEKHLDDIERHQQIINKGFEHFLLKVERQLQRIVQSFYEEQLRYIDIWVNEYQIRVPLTFWESSSNNENACNRVVHEVKTALAARMSDTFKAWERATLRPLIDREIDSYTLQFNQQIRQFIEVFEQIRAEVLQENGTLTTSIINSEKGFGDMLVQVSDYRENVSKITFDFGKTLKSALLSSDVFASLTIFLDLQPLHTPAAKIISNCSRNKNLFNEEVKQEVGRAYKEEFIVKKRDFDDKVFETIDQQFEYSQQNLDGELEREIQSFREYLQNTLTAQIEGELDQKLNELEQCHKELKSINDSIKDIIDQLTLARHSGKR